jgi:hypothetical protein
MCSGGARLPTAVLSHGNLLALVANLIDDSLSFDFWRGLSNPDVFEVTRSSTLPVLSRVWPGPN